MKYAFPSFALWLLTIASNDACAQLSLSRTPDENTHALECGSAGYVFKNNSRDSIYYFSTKMDEDPTGCLRTEYRIEKDAGIRYINVSGHLLATSQRKMLPLKPNEETNFIFYRDSLENSFLKIYVKAAVYKHRLQKKSSYYRYFSLN